MTERTSERVSDEEALEISSRLCVHKRMFTKNDNTPLFLCVFVFIEEKKR